MKIARLIGSAGSGKTTELLRIMESALPKIGSPLRLGFASFTRAARAEAVARASAAWNVSPSVLSGEGWFRTLHSTTMRCLGVERKQMLADSVADIEWISEAVGEPIRTSIDDDTGNQRYIGGVAGASLNCWNLARSTLRPLEHVVRELRRLDDNVPEFAAVVRTAEHYETRKRLDDRLDFTDLLLMFSGYRLHARDGVQRCEPDGFLPDVAAWIFDEQQDVSPLLDAVCKRLVSAESVKWCYAAGDPFQSLYGWCGGTADCFLGWPADKERIMPKSYRCPAPILALGERCLLRMRRGYFDRRVAPADHHGTVTESEFDHVVSLARPDEDWLFLARTNYEAGRLYAALNAQGNPARWIKQAEGVSVRCQGLQALLALEDDRSISGNQWARAIELLPTTNKDKEPILTRGTKTNWAKKHADDADVLFRSDLESVGATPRLIDLIASGRWCSLVNNSERWRRSARKWGPELASESGIRVGTVHAAKGMEADNVALLTTISKRVDEGLRECERQHDEECRIAYVGVTRARRNLHVVNEYRQGRMVRSMEVA